MEAQFPLLAVDAPPARAAAPAAGHADGRRAAAAGGLDLYVLVVAAVLAQMLDAASGAWMMHTRGLTSELNPLMRAVFAGGGAPTLMAGKLVLALAGVAAFVTLAGTGRGRLARLCLVVTIGVGLVGWWSNLP